MLLDSFQKVNKLDEMVAMHMQLLSIHRLYPISISTLYYCFIKQATIKTELEKKNLVRSLKIFFARHQSCQFLYTFDIQLWHIFAMPDSIIIFSCEFPRSNILPPSCPSTACKTLKVVLFLHIGTNDQFCYKIRRFISSQVVHSCFCHVKCCQSSVFELFKFNS